MKKIFLLVACMCAAVLLKAQKVSEGAVLFDKQSQPGFVLNISALEVDFVTDALKYSFEDKYAMKGSNVSGFRAYKRQRFIPFGSEGYDIYFKAEQNGPKKNREVKVSLLVSIDGVTFVTRASDRATADKVVAFLENFVQVTIPEYTTKVRITEVSAQLKKLEDKKKDLEKKQEKLNKELLEVKQELEQNAEDIQKAQQELNSLNQK